MGRWEPGARERLQGAALELFAERGYEGTTIEEIAARAGLTKRTFFRHFADKREVLAGGPEFQQTFVDALAAAPAGAAPLDAVAKALEAGGALLADRREGARLRQAVIGANDELRERELVKLASVSAAMAAELRERGVDEPAASLAAETGMTVFRVAFERWIADGEERELPDLVAESLAALRGVAAT
jgi:AcrR family transcriptional regulator